MTWVSFYFFICVGEAMPCDMWDLGSLTSDQPLTPCIGSAES